MKLLLLTLLLIPGMLHAKERMEMGFVLTWGPIELAKLHYAMTWDQERYEISGHGNTTGLVGAMVDWGGQAMTRGYVDASGMLVPLRHSHEGVLGDSRRGADATYRDRQVVTWSVSPSHEELEQTSLPTGLIDGVIDPLTFIGRLILGQARDKNCSLSEKLFDGRRLSTIQFVAGDEEGCSLKSQRLGGFTKKYGSDPRGRLTGVALSQVGDLYLPKGFKLEAPIGVVRAERFYLKRNDQFIERIDGDRPQADKTGLSLVNSKETWSAN